MWKEIYQTAKFASDSYFFDEKEVWCYDNLQKEHHVSLEDYEAGVDQVFHSIITRDGDVLKNVDALMNLIRHIHYGNASATKFRVMHFTEEIEMKLFDYKLLEGDFYQMQERLQAKVEVQATFREMHLCIRNHFEQLTAQIYRTEKTKDTQVMEQVKKYIQEHYADELSVKTLADIACVSTNYFSAMFKREIGENYKTYLTKIRMEKAMDLLLHTDMKSYEIGEAVGYNNVRRFVEAFKQIYGMSPMDYKRKRNA